MSATVTTEAAGSSGSLARGRVFQFTASVQGTGVAAFLAGANLSVSGADFAEAVGDVDGDGDLDLLTASYAGMASVRLNGGDASGSNTGTFAGGSAVLVNGSPYGLALGDVDGDGDLDIVACGNNVVSARPNQSAQVLAATPALAPAAGSLAITPTVAEAGTAPRYCCNGPLPGTTLAVYTLHGQLVRTQPLDTATGSLPTEGLAPGWYVAQVGTPGQRLVARLYLP